MKGKGVFHPVTRIRLLLMRMTILFLAILLVVCVLIYSIGDRQMCRQMQQELDNYAHITTTHLQLQLESAMSIQLELQLDNFLQNNISPHFSTDYREFRDFSKRIMDRANNNSFIDTLDVYVGAYHMFFTSDKGPSSYLDARTRAYLDDILGVIQETDWTVHYRENIYYWLSRAQDHITILMPVTSRYTGKTVAFAAISLSRSSLSELLMLGEDAYAYLIDAQGNVLAANTDTPLTQLSDHGYLKSTRPVGDFGWQVVYVRHRSNISTLNNAYMLGMFLITLAAIGAIWLVAMNMLKRIEKRMKPLTNLMETVKQGDYHVAAIEKEQDEFSYLYDQFESMVGHIDRQFNEIYKLKILEQEARMKLMQAQINPHFIYNIFNNMSWMIELKRYDRLAELTDAVSVFYRRSLNEGQETIRVSEEIEKLGSYVRIQQIRFGERLRCSIEIEEAIADKRMLNHILQPIVENAVVHGIEPRARIGSVQIIGREKENGDLEFVIRDDGVGIAQERLMRLHDMLRQTQQNEIEPGGEFFALRNVHARMHISYGVPYGLTVESSQNEGTCVTVLLPANPDKGGENRVSDDDRG